MDVRQLMRSVMGKAWEMTGPQALAAEMRVAGGNGGKEDGEGRSSTASFPGT
jgi:hypothetical protein